MDVIGEEPLNGKDAFLKKLSQHFKDDCFSDVTLIVGNKRYPAHKSILAAFSTYFQCMFYAGHWKEGKGEEVQLRETAECKAVFEAFLKYFYSGTVSVNKKTVVPVVTLADKYDVEGLKKVCTSYMVDMLNTKSDIEAALTWLPFAEQMSMRTLSKKCYDLICLNFDKACSLEGWLSLPLELVLTILKRSDIVVSSEFAVYLAVQTWLRWQENVTPNEVSQILPHIQFKNMTVREICEVEKSPLGTNEWCKTDNLLHPYLFDAFRYFAITEHYPEGDCKHARLQRRYTGDALDPLVENCHISS